jgi:hypothetical protein
MIILTNTTDTVQVILSQSVAANQMQCYVSFRDTTSTTITPGSRVVNTNNTTAVDIVQAPGSLTQRIVDFISIQNIDTSQNDVTIRFNDNSTTYILFKTRLNIGDKIEYHDGKGFKVINSAGGQVAYKINDTVPSNLNRSTIYLPQDVNVTTSGTTFVSQLTIPGLEFPIIAQKWYAVTCNVIYDINATTIGARIGVALENLQTAEYSIMGIIGATTSSYIVNYLNNVAYVGNATSATSPFTTENCARIEGMFKATSNGMFRLGAGHELTGTMTVKKGSMIHFTQIT